LQKRFEREAGVKIQIRITLRFPVQKIHMYHKHASSFLQKKIENEFGLKNLSADQTISSLTLAMTCEVNGYKLEVTFGLFC
jgi:hypothetical protein